MIWLKNMERLHIIVDHQLPEVYSCVQGAHATAQYILENDDSWKNDYLIFLKGDVEKVINKLESRNVKYTAFREPDLNNQLTAIAVLNNGKLFKNLKLVGN